MFGGVSGKEVDEFARGLAQDIAKRYPPKMDSGGAERKISQKRLTAILEEAYSRASTFRNTNKLGVYKKARLSNTFRWELEELGYTKPFIEVATEGLVVHISRKPAAASK